MEFIDQLRAEVKLHGDMETDFKSRRYHQARNIAGKYIDMIEEQARIAARSGDYERVEGKAIISGFVRINEKDFDMPIVQTQKHKKFMHKKTHEISLVPENELFEVFLSAFRQMCAEEHITFFPFQARITGENGQIFYQTLPCTIRKPKKERIEAFGFPYQIEF